MHEPSQPKITFNQLQQLCSGGGWVGYYSDQGKFGFTIQSLPNNTIVYWGAAVYDNPQQALATGEEAMRSIRRVDVRDIKRRMTGRVASWLMASPPGLMFASVNIWPLVEDVMTRR